MQLDDQDELAPTADASMEPKGKATAKASASGGAKAKAKTTKEPQTAEQKCDKKELKKWCTQTAKVVKDYEETMGAASTLQAAIPVAPSWSKFRSKTMMEPMESAVETCKLANLSDFARLVLSTDMKEIQQQFKTPEKLITKLQGFEKEMEHLTKVKEQMAELKAMHAARLAKT